MAEPFAIRHSDGTWSGISIELWREIAAELGLAFELKQTDLPGLFSGLQDGSLDASVAALTVTERREEICDFTHPYFSSGLGIAVSTERRRGILGLVRGILSIEFLEAVGALLLVLLVAGGLVWVFERRKNPEQFDARAGRGLASAVWWSAVTMTTVGYGDMAPRTLGGRVVALVWMFTSVVIVSGFTASLTSALTVDQLQVTVQGLEDLPRVRVATVKASTSEGFLADRQIRYRTYPTAADAVTALEDGEVDAVVYDAPILRYLISSRGLSSLRVLPQILERQNYAIALRQGSPYREQVNRALLRITASDAWAETLDRYLGR